MGKILVTGAAGFIGSHVVDELIKIGKDVIALDDLSGGFKENVNKKANFYEGSINDLILLENLFIDHKIEYIFHLAAYAAEGLSHFIRHFNYKNNLIGSINLINLAVKHEIKCFVFTSSIAVYGKNQLPFTEDTIPQPEDPYGVAKYAIELDLKCAYKMFGLNYIIFRPHNVYGERQNIGDKYRNVIGIFINNIMQGKGMPIFGDGEQTRAFSYIGDVAKPIAHSIFRESVYNHIFNIGADKPYTINELVNEIAEIFNIKPKLIYLPERNEVKHAYSDHKKGKEYFGDLIENVDLNTGLRRMITWANKIGVRESKKFKNIEITKNLPKSWVE